MQWGLPIALIALYSETPKWLLFAAWLGLKATKKCQGQIQSEAE